MLLVEERGTMGGIDIERLRKDGEGGCCMRLGIRIFAEQYIDGAVPREADVVLVFRDGEVLFARNLCRG